MSTRPSRSSFGGFVPKDEGWHTPDLSVCWHKPQDCGAMEITGQVSVVEIEHNPPVNTNSSAVARCDTPAVPTLLVMSSLAGNTATTALGATAVERTPMIPRTTVLRGRSGSWAWFPPESTGPRERKAHCQRADSVGSFLSRFLRPCVESRCGDWFRPSSLPKRVTASSRSHSPSMFSQGRIRRPRRR